jgi:LCP family protein required for cell wall assembly
MRRPEPPLAARAHAVHEPGPLRPRAHQQRRTRRRRRALLIATLAVVVVAAVAAAFVAAATAKVSENLAQNVIERPGEEAPEVPVVPDWDGPVNLLIMGSDERAGLTSGDYGEDSGARSDVMMLLHVSADHSNATLVSIPRDTMLPIPECTTSGGEVIAAQGPSMINSALMAGPYCSMDAIRDFTGLPVDHFIVVDFDGVIGVTDAIGGVDVCVATDVEDPYSGLFLPAGEHSITGVDALAFLRTRHGFGDGSDLGRIAAQQTYLAALARKVTSAGTLTNPFALFALADAASKAIHVDEGLSTADALVGLAGTLAGIDLDHIALVQLPVQDYEPDPNRVEPIADQAAALFAALAADHVIGLPSGEPDEPVSPEGDGDEAVDGGDGAEGAAPDSPAAPAEPSAPGSATTTLGAGTKGQTAAAATCAGATR